MTYQQAYDKIIQAYFKNDIKPYNTEFCFCGTLCDNSILWANNSYETYYKNHPHNDYGNYSGVDYANMERALIDAVQVKIGVINPGYEDRLFTGMCAALDVLKEIHRSRGEDVDIVLSLTKRVLI